MWPSTRRLWPPLVCLCNLWGSWEEGVPARERRCEGLQRGTSQGANQRDGQGLGPLAARQGRQQEVRGCRRRPLLAWRSAARYQHHTCVTATSEIQSCLKEIFENIPSDSYTSVSIAEDLSACCWPCSFLHGSLGPHTLPVFLSSRPFGVFLPSTPMISMPTSLSESQLLVHP